MVPTNFRYMHGVATEGLPKLIRTLRFERVVEFRTQVPFKLGYETDRIEGAYLFDMPFCKTRKIAEDLNVRIDDLFYARTLHLHSNLPAAG